MTCLTGTTAGWTAALAGCAMRTGRHGREDSKKLTGLRTNREDRCRSPNTDARRSCMRARDHGGTELDQWWDDGGERMGCSYISSLGGGGQVDMPLLAEYQSLHCMRSVTSVRQEQDSCWGVVLPLDPRTSLKFLPMHSPSVPRGISLG